MEVLQTPIFTPAWVYRNFNLKLILAILGIKPNARICAVYYTSLMWTVDLEPCINLDFILIYFFIFGDHAEGKLLLCKH